MECSDAYKQCRVSKRLEIRFLFVLLDFLKFYFLFPQFSPNISPYRLTVDPYNFNELLALFLLSSLNLYKFKKYKPLKKVMLLTIGGMVSR